MKSLLGVVLFASSLSAVAATNTDYSDTHHVEVGLGVDQGLSAVLNIDKKHQITVGNDGAAYDYRLTEGKFDDPTLPFTWYVSAGVWGQWDDNDHDDYGVRLPVGVDWAFTDKMRIYGQLQPEVAVEDDDPLQLGASLGMTYSF